MSSSQAKIFVSSVYAQKLIAPAWLDLEPFQLGSAQEISAKTHL